MQAWREIITLTNRKKSLCFRTGTEYLCKFGAKSSCSPSEKNCCASDVGQNIYVNLARNYPHLKKEIVVIEHRGKKVYEEFQT
jgi:hypothetical protein